MHGVLPVFLNRSPKKCAEKKQEKLEENAFLNRFNYSESVEYEIG